MCGICGCNETSAAHHHTVENSRLIQLEQNILAENERYAAENRLYLTQRGVMSFNLVSSPGSGKTTLLEQTLVSLKASYPIAVIEGDQQTDRDARRISATGTPVVQINTGKKCHLDAHQIAHALPQLSLAHPGFLFIENVGNLVCPALFDLGEHYRVVILSVTEGDDKPLKYPEIFHTAHLLIINKIDLLAYVDFDLEHCREYAYRCNPNLQILQLSAKTGQGMATWLTWLADKLKQPQVFGYTAQSPS